MFRIIWIELNPFGGDFEVRFFHIAAVKCNQKYKCDRVRHQEGDGEDGVIMEH